ncbi:ABC transporter substrate-binding protein [Acetobacteraceae bacterium H6797]|nr:ABC transporter substrate-binding protein [Acetobacteraceae bacterium H6797]
MLRQTLLATLPLAALLAAPMGATAQAQPADTMRIAVEGGPTSIDPHFASVITNYAYARHFFQPLMEQDATQQLRPAIATSWRVVDPLTWEIKLNPDVRFQDGTPVTVEDVAFTLSRAGDVPNSPSSLNTYTRPIKAVEQVDAHTLLIRTHEPTPLMANYLSMVMILAKHAAEGLSTSDFNSGKGMVGTGPYRYVSWQPGGVAVMERYDGFQGPKPAFARVEFRPIANSGSRVAALRSGDVDLIEVVPTDEFERLRKETNFAVAESPSNRLIFLTLDSDREQSPYVTGRDGKPIPNPLRDPRVRRALSKAINRDALVQRVMQGQAVASNDLAPAGYFGTTPDLQKAEPFDLEGARKLLAEAGFPNGFSVQVNGPNDRYPNDEKVVQAIAQMWTRLGLNATVETKPRGPWLSEAAQLKYSVNLTGFSPNPEVLGMLESQIHSFDRARGMGSQNRGRFSNAELDALIMRTRVTMDDAERARLSSEATRKAILEQQAIIPLYFQVNTWAMRKGLSYEARTDEMTLATSVRRTGN